MMKMVPPTALRTGTATVDEESEDGVVLGVIDGVIDGVCDSEDSCRGWSRCIVMPVSGCCSLKEETVVLILLVNIRQCGE